MNSLTHSAAGFIRTLARQPGFALAVILILALGIGANTATLSLLYRYFYAPLPYPAAHRLVEIQFVTPKEGMQHAVSAPAYHAVRTQARALANSALFQDWHGFNLSLGHKTLHVTGTSCTASLFPTLGVAPLLGHVFARSSEAPGTPPVIVLSYLMWNKLLHRYPQIIGHTLHLNGQLYTVIGLMPRGFWFPSRRSLFWVPQPLTEKDEELDRMGRINYSMIGRLTSGAGLSQLTVQTRSILQQTVAKIPGGQTRAYFQNHHVQLLPQFWRTRLMGRFHHSLILMQLATGLLILLAWFNLANLFVTRALVRRGELIIRRVLGASSRRLFVELLMESLVLCVTGAALGLLLGHLMVTLLQHSGLVSGAAIPQTGWWPTIAMASALGLLSSLVFAVAGFYCVRHQNLSQALREDSARASSGGGERRIRAGLVVVQVALACGLTGMGLMLGRSILNLNAVNLGFQAPHVLTFQVDLPSSHYGPRRMVAGLSALREKLRAVPGIASASIASDVPFDGSANYYGVFPYPWKQQPSVDLFTTIADSGYFRALGISVLAGRTFTDLDRTQGEGQAVIDTLAARELFGTTQVLGREFSFSPNKRHPGAFFKVIGLVRTIHHVGVAHSRHTGSIYVDRSQVLRWNKKWSENQWMVTIRTPLHASRILPLARNAVAVVLPGVAMYDIRTLKQRLDSHLAYRRGLAVLVVFFSLSALLLAAVGLYAVQSYTVRQRTREFGTRAALGADRSRLLRLVLTEAGRLLAIGLILGLTAMVVIGQLFASVLYGVSPLDPMSVLIVLGILAVTLFLAAWVPAWRASRVPPAVALRQE